MSEKSAFLVLLLSLFLPFGAHAQEVISRLEIKAKETYVVGQDNVLLVDTLIMHDKAVILFNPELPAFLGVNNAYVGKNCKLITKRLDGSFRRTETHGSDGQDGAPIEMDIHFITLGRLTIDSRDSNGDTGADGRGETPSTKRTDGDGSYTSLSPNAPAQQGGAGGNGGNGGSIILTYSTEGFIPSFNRHRNHHAIILLHKGGKAGKPGRYGKVEGLEGTDGQVKLNNKNLAAGSAD